MKRTCNGCRAASILRFCYLGYNTEIKYSSGFMRELVPLEDCPKPETNADYVKTEHKEDLK